MFEIKMFNDMTQAADYMHDKLASLDLKTNQFNLCHSMNENECSTEEGDIDIIHSFLVDFLRDLDAQEGVVCYDGKKFDFTDDDENPKVADNYYNNSGSLPGVFVKAGEGVTTILNGFACGEYTFPFVVVKQGLYYRHGTAITEKLKVFKADKEEYTTKVLPALYVEIID